MFIELTDILRCPEPHDEQFVVLIPDEMAGRSVRTGRLGCPVCHREYLIRDGVAEFSEDGDDRASGDPAIASDALVAFLGISGPGGYAGIVGGSAAFIGGLSEAVPAVHFVGINSTPGSAEGPMLSILRAASIPIKSRSLRGVVLLAPFATDPAWQREAARSVLPGLRVVGQGEPPPADDLSILASAGGWWVAQKIEGLRD